ncbi:MAG: AI-2E family transporter [Actinomycetota bacterium]|nr:AI-2E family transporter [Actinomycetota bacterium]
MSDGEGALPTELSGDAPLDLGGIGGLVGDKSLPPWFWRAVIAVAFSVLAFAAVRGALGRLTGLLSLIGVSLFLSFAVEPAVNWLADRGWRRGRATLACFLVIFGGGGIFMGLMVGLVVGQVSDLAHQAPDYVTEVTNWANETFDTEITSTELNETLADYQDDLARMATDMGGRVLSVTGAALGVVFQLFTVMLFSYYMIAEGPRLRRNVCSLLPERRQHVVLRLWELSIEKTGGWVFSRLLLATVAGVTSWVVFVALGLPSPLALALWLGLVSQFIPVVGTYLGGALPLLVALVNRPITALWVLAWILIYQQIENYLLSPKITAHTMDLHPAVAFGSALAGASLFGPMGAILALPAAAVIQAFVSAYLDRHDVIENDLTKLDEIEATQGESAFRRALRRVSRDEPIE